MDALTSFSYRGNGCPGPTRFEVADGRTAGRRAPDTRDPRIAARMNPAGKRKR
jgi:hypothetical protein